MRQLTLTVITEGEAPSFTQRLEVLCLLVSISPAVQHLLGLCETQLTPCLWQVQVKSVSSWDMLLISCPMPQVAVRNSTSGSNSVFWELGKQDTGGMAKYSLPVLAVYKDLAPFLFCAQRMKCKTLYALGQRSPNSHILTTGYPSSWSMWQKQNALVRPKKKVAGSPIKWKRRWQWQSCGGTSSSPLHCSAQRSNQQLGSFLPPHTPLPRLPPRV